MTMLRKMRVALLFGAGLTIATPDACASDRLVSARAPDAAARQRDIDGVRSIAAWNVIALQTTAGGVFSPPRESRAMAMVSAAVFDAVASITEEYEPFAVRVVAPPDASTEAAVGAAAHHVLVALYPAAAQALDAAYDASLSQIPEGPTRQAGAAAGESAAAAVLAMRAHDHALERADYSPGHGAGVWVPTPPAFVAALEAGWGRVDPFVLDSGSQFRPAPPPSLQSATYARDLLEIVKIGVSNSATRTAAQTETARFWISTAPQLWNQAVRQVTGAMELDVTTAARVYLALNTAGADAMIAAWDAKFAYNQWRPVTAIRNADGLTIPRDSTWTSLLVTPPFPDYPAGHTAYAGAAEQVLSGLLGEHPREFSISSPTAAGATHNYATFHGVADEVVDARVWGGVHWRSSSTVGRELGRRVGDVVLARVPKRVVRPT